ncbi:TIGR02171 family protein [uncultured Fibrobacter sp.]|uniref:TIGR02171 family lipoprotein n=1 Tax=uncultured Fibrobacter sp. TaxID=261512 RepID=UPI0025D68343|nr:TIGR02171 family protein [uncultured Fibrobacter sp.]
MYRFISVLIFLAVIVACSNSESYTSDTDESSDALVIDTIAEDSVAKDTVQAINGMVYVKGGTVTVGSNDKNFKANERPAMNVVLNYDFYMGVHEVTCGDYNKIAKETALKTFEQCDNDDLPITDITYYDAVLYANAKSKRERYDTAYTYSKAVFNNDGHCTFLEGVSFHADAKAFRLPTEAEWIYAATRAWDTSKSWNNGNSGYKLHTVCSKDTNSAGLCDMAGNAMEWVNDWMGVFRDTTVTNYVGAPDGGDMGERVIKGGSYTSSETELNPYSRGDVYTVTSSTRAEYVGFRLAFGSIPNALWMSDDGVSQTSIVTSLAGNETVKGITGTYNTKLAFRNDVSGNIAIIDYLNGASSVKEITKGIDAYHPEISPDGKWIAYCTGFEGVSGKSTIFVQSIEDASASPIKLDVKKAVIPRWRVLQTGDTAIIYVSDASNNKEKATFKAASTWQVSFTGGKFGIPQKLFDGAYHGGISEDNALAVTGARLLRARVDGRDTVWYNGEQACNASLAMDRSKRTAFLDFGGKTGRDFVGSNYTTHQRILIADSTGKLIQSIGAPSRYTFDHTEWTTDNTKTNIVATLTNINGAHTKIVLVNPIDSSITELAEGEELWHPNLWVKKRVVKQSSSSSAISSTLFSSSSKALISSGSEGDMGSSSEIAISSSSESVILPEIELDPDSAGIYYKSGATYQAVNMRIKMELLWKYRDSSNVVILGSSRAKNSLIPNQLSEGFHAINLANSGFSINESHYLYFNYIQYHVKNLKFLIVALDIDLWWVKYESSNNFFYSEAKEISGYIYDQNHQFWKDFVPEDLYQLTFESIGGNTYAKKFRDTRGYEEYETASGWKENPTITRDTNWMQKDPSLYENSFNLLKEIVESCNQNNVYVIGIIFPQSPAYKNTGSFGYNGPQRSAAMSAIEDFKNLSKKYPYFILMDENKMGDHDYSDDMARDEEHLSVLGAIQITGRLDSLLSTLK